jgi:selenocysteine-specific elongation factor
MAELVVLIDEYHAAHPLEPFAPSQLLRSRLAGSSELVEASVARLRAEGTLELVGASIRRAGWMPALSAADRAALDAAERRLAEAGLEPPGTAELVAELGGHVPALLRLAARDGRILALDGERYVDGAAIEALVGRLHAVLVPGREYAPAELREVVGVSRKYLMPILELFDRRKLTERTEGGRCWRGT